LKFNKLCSLVVGFTLSWLMLSGFKGSPLPSFHQGFATSASGSAHPKTWNGLIHASMSSFGPTGTTLRDVTRFGHNGTFSQMGPEDWAVQAGDGFFPSGHVLNFPSDNDRVLHTGYIPAAGAERRTTIMWMNPTATGNLYFLNWGTSGSGTRHSQRFSGATSLRIEIGSGGDTSSLAATLNEWNFVGLTFDGTDLSGFTHYLNGASDAATGTNTINTGTGVGLTIGSSTLNNGDFTGAIAMVLIYNRELTAKEMLFHYMTPGAPFHLSSPTVGFVAAAAAAVAPKRTIMGTGTKIIERRNYSCGDIYCY